MGKTENHQGAPVGKQGQPGYDSTSILRPPTATIPEPVSAEGNNNNHHRKRRWTKDAPMFWVTLAGVIAVIAYTTVAAWQACLTRDQLAIMEADQRPWVKVEFTATDAFKVERNVGFLPFRPEITNVGHSPAFNVRYLVRGTTGGGGKDEALLEQKKICDDLRHTKYDDGSSNAVLFPNDKYDPTRLAIDDYRIQAPIRKKDIGQARGKDDANFWFFGCVDYLFSTGESHHQTGFVYHLGRVLHAVDGEPEGSIAYPFYLADITPISDLRLYPIPPFDGQTD